MDTFGQAVQAWQPFYGTIATASAGLIGLLFVALSLNVTILIRTESADLKLLATQTFATFVIIIAFSLMFLIPDQGPVGLGLPLVCIGIAGLIGSVRAIRPTGADRPWGSLLVFTRRVGLRLVALIATVFLAGWIMVVGDANSLYWLVAPMILLLVSATVHVWSLLIGIQQALGQK